MKDETYLTRTELDRLLAQLEKETGLFYRNYPDVETRCREFAVRGAAIRARALPQDEPYVFASLCAVYARRHGFCGHSSKPDSGEVEVAPHVEQRADTRLARVMRTIRDIDLGRLRPTG
jgi:hypothetical protein